MTLDLVHLNFSVCADRTKGFSEAKSESVLNIVTFERKRVRVSILCGITKIVLKPLKGYSQQIFKMLFVFERINKRVVALCQRHPLNS